LSRQDLENLQGGRFRRRTKRKLAVFIDGIGLDRATKRLNRKVELSLLLKGVCEGLTPVLAKYYTLVPHEDDARQFSFLDAVERGGLEPVVRHLPPKGVKRTVSIDVLLATDLLTFAMAQDKDPNTTDTENADTVKKQAVIVCPSRDLIYAIDRAHSHGVEVSLADFGFYGNSDGWKGVDRWIDLSTSEIIWRG